MDPKPKKHVFVCTNDRGPDGTCCKNVKGVEIWAELKRWVMEQGKVRDVYVTQSKCLGFCNNEGANVVIYPDNKWFLKTKLEDLQEVKENL